MTADRSVYANRLLDPVSENPFERFHLFWDPTIEAFKSSHIGMSRGDDRYIRRTNPVETVEWLIPGWRVLTRLRAEETLSWRDSGRSIFGADPATQQKAKMEHMLIARHAPDRNTAHDASAGAVNWALLTLPTTRASVMFRSWGEPHIRRWNFADWEPHERVWAIQFALRTAVLGASPVALADKVCRLHEDGCNTNDLKWWNPPHQAHTLSLALNGKTGSGAHPSAASRKAALIEHAETLTAARTMFALGAVRDYDTVIATSAKPTR